jgi:hypothetical protein
LTLVIFDLRELFRDPQNRAARAWIGGHLLNAGPHRLSHYPQPWSGEIAVADRQAVGQRTCACVFPHEALDDPVLERMEADHRQSSKGIENREGLWKR